jgi:hypothetical protein
MSPIVLAMYDVLRVRTPKPVPRKALISVGELVVELYRYEGVPGDLGHRGDPRLDEAVLTVVEICDALELPPLPALITGDGEFGPLPVFARERYSNLQGDREKMLSAWEKDLKDVAITFYPDELEIEEE